jgi:hypothetical protein
MPTAVTELAAHRKQDTSAPVRHPRSMNAPGLRLKQLVLALGAAYLGIVALTNLVNLVAAVSGGDWAFLNSGNDDYVASVIAVYSWPSWLGSIVVLAALVLEGIGSALFVRALSRYRGGGSGATEAYQALGWNLGVWVVLLLGTEFFVAYGAGGTFRELIAIALLMTLVVALVPDTPHAAER